MVQVEVAESVVQASPRDDVLPEESAEDSADERLRSLAPQALPLPPAPPMPPQA